MTNFTSLRAFFFSENVQLNQSHCYTATLFGNLKLEIGHTDKNGAEILKWTALLQYYTTYIAVKTAKANEKQGSHSHIFYTTGYRIET